MVTHYKNKHNDNREDSKVLIHKDRLQKIAYVPLSMGAQQAMGDPSMMGGQPPMPPQGGQPPMPPQGGDPAMMGGDPGMPTPPMDPSMMVGEGGMPPMDPETGWMLVDPQNGIVMEPTTGILFSKMDGMFISPDGQPMPPDQAMMMLEQAGVQPPMPPQGGDPSMMGGEGGMPPAGAPAEPPMPPMPPQGGQPPMEPGMDPGMDPAMMGGQPPMPPMPPQGGDPSMMGEEGGMPQGPNDMGTFPPVSMNQLPGASAGMAGAEEGDIDQMLPGFSDFMSRTEQQANKQGKINQRVIKELSGVRGDLQGVMRELNQFTDNQDTLLARLTDMANRLERHMAATTGVPMDRGM